MESLNFALFASLSLLLIASTIDARTDPGAYWKSAMKDQEMPEAIQGLINWRASALPISNKKTDIAEGKHPVIDSGNIIFSYHEKDDKKAEENKDSGNLVFYYHEKNDKNAEENNHGQDVKKAEENKDSGNLLFYYNQRGDRRAEENKYWGNLLFVYHPQGNKKVEENKISENLFFEYHPQGNKKVEESKDRKFNL